MGKDQPSKGGLEPEPLLVTKRSERLSDDPKYLRLRDSYPDVLTRRFEATRIKLGEHLAHLVQAQQISPPTNRPAGDHGPPIISLF